MFFIQYPFYILFAAEEVIFLKIPFYAWIENDFFLNL